MPEEMKKMPRDGDVIELLKNFLARGRLLRDNMAARHNIRNFLVVFPQRFESGMVRAATV